MHRVDHPVAHDALGNLRRQSTPPAQFRALTHRIGFVLITEATRDFALSDREIDTPLERTTTRALTADVVLVPVLRAGLGLLDAALVLLPAARVGHVGLQRDETTAVASRYYSRLPEVSTGTTVLVLDPMLATGGSASAAVSLVRAAGANDVRVLSVVAAPEGLRTFESAWPDVPVYVVAIDRQLNAHKFILPGLGDFGDRLYGT